METLGQILNRITNEPQRMAQAAWPVGPKPSETVDDQRLESRKGECGLRGVPLKFDFSWFKPEKQPTPEAQEQAKVMLDAMQVWSAAEPPERPWLVIPGLTGTGKTELAKTATWNAKRNGHWCYYIEAYEFDKRVKDFKREWDTATEGVPINPDEWVRNLAECEYLVVDDIGAGYIDKGWTLSRFETLFDIRYSRRMPTLITTNLDKVEFREHIGFRVWSRMFDTEISRVLDTSAMQDYRPLKEQG